MAGITAKVSVEKIVHLTVCDMLKKLVDETGVRVDSIVVDWIDVTENEKPDFIIRNLSLTTMTRH